MKGNEPERGALSSLKIQNSVGVSVRIQSTLIVAVQRSHANAFETCLQVEQ